MGQKYILQKGINPDKEVIAKLESFLQSFETLEVNNDIPVILLLDEKSQAFYISCHIYGQTLTKKADLEAVLDPEESEEYKLNRDIYTDSYAYKIMEKDASELRSFEDLVVEFDPSYNSGKPLKVFGGQHRIKAVEVASGKKVNCPHGVRVYFALSTAQKVEIAQVNNTSIAVSNDLLDRMQEDLLGSDLRSWCQQAGLLKDTENFADRRSPEGIPTVRLARTFLVNYVRGKSSRLDEFNLPMVCKSGPGPDPDYLDIRDAIDWKGKGMLEAGRQFSRLHAVQRQTVLERDKLSYLEFANKLLHPSVTASWAFATGMFQNNPELLANHYSLVDSVTPPDDPLGASFLQAARLKGIDQDTYRGIGSRIGATDLGRMLEVFLIQANAQKRGINKKVADAAIKSFHAKKATQEAEKAKKGI